MTHDEVNSPQHYNVNGIEVIDVIETYTPNSPHLANVLKYVCRHSYKGKPLQDLRKAAWYLTRAIDILEEEEAVKAEVAELMDTSEAIDLRNRIKDAVLLCFEDEDDATFDAYGRVVGTVPPVNIYGEPFAPEPECLDDEGRCSFTGRPCSSEEDCIVDTLDADGPFERGTEGPCCGLTRDEVAERFEAESVVDALYVRTSPSRIAGDDDEAKRIKNDYYSHTPFEIVGYCAYCDAELEADDTFLEGVAGYDATVKFCGVLCVDKLRKWQGR